MSEANCAQKAEAAVDLELVGRVQSGDKQAFGILVERYQNRILHVLTPFLKNRADAEDVAQDTFVRAYRALANFKGDSAFYTWLYRIAINTAKNYLAAKKVRPPSSDIDMADVGESAFDIKLRDEDSPEELVHRDQIESAVYKAMGELPDEQRTALMLREIDGMSYEDIAITTECPIGTVRSRIFRARDAIERVINPMLNDQN
ncbi:MAG: RNA polymerase sigma factor RpoE [Gammaproteobacteria bacterium]|nr:RNA polymerase sigma factor RpoE [Gammaproteobacteria bacterium]